MAQTRKALMLKLLLSTILFFLFLPTYIGSFVLLRRLILLLGCILVLSFLVFVSLLRILYRHIILLSRFLLSWLLLLNFW